MEECALIQDAYADLVILVHSVSIWIPVTVRLV